MSDLEAFLDHVCAWPASEEDAGFISLHWIDKSKPARFGAPGKPYRDRDAFVWMVNFLLSKGGKLDLYFCNTRQSKTKISKGGKIVSDRKREHALCTKALWVDVDVKPETYNTIEDALGGLAQFCATTKMPLPNIIVESGSGGMHIYWVFNRPITMAEWEPMAKGLVNAIHREGFKVNDTGCTTDPARILRLPGTLNHKTEPPKEVKLRRNNLTDYDPDEIARALAPWRDPIRVSGSTGTAAPGGNNAQGAAVGHNATHPQSGGNASPIYLAVSWEKPNLPPGFRMEGCGVVEPPTYDPLPVRPIYEGCQFIREAVITGGKKYDQAQWRFTTLIATALEHGEKLAHGMAKGHPEYTPVSTTDMWERCLTDVAGRPQLAFTSCEKIMATGYSGCATCPARGHIKSPLNLATQWVAAQHSAAPGNLAPAGQVAQTVGASQQPNMGGSQSGLYLPKGYVLDGGIICKMHLTKDDIENGLTAEHPIPMFLTALDDPWYQADGHPGIKCKAAIGNTWKPTYIPNREMQLKGTAIAELAERNVLTSRPFAEPFLGSFFMGWIKQLQDAKRTISSRTFGWIDSVINDKVVANSTFIYGGWQWHADGTKSPASYTEAALQRSYDPKGDRQPWIDAYERIIAAQDRADLDCIVATGFGASLMQFSGQAGCLLAVNGPSSAGKSTAINIANSIWCHWKTGKVNMNSTENHVNNKMGKLGHLPVYWDEIQEDALPVLKKVAFSLVQGAEKGRLKSDTTIQMPQDWCTILVSGSNFLLWDYIVEVQKTTNAGLVRVFEYTVEKRDPPHMEHVDVDMLCDDLLHNYGAIGLEYSAYLATQSPFLKDRITATIKRFTAAVTDQTIERCWVALCASIQLGAELANEIGITRFNLDKMFKFLTDNIIRLRGKLDKEANDASSEVNIEETLTSFLRDHAHQTLHTDTAPSGRGSRVIALPLVIPPHDSRVVKVQYVRDDSTLRFSYKELLDWLKAKGNFGRSAVMEGFEKNFGATIKHLNLGVGTKTYKQGPERVVVIPIPQNSWMWSTIPGNVTENNNGVDDDGTSKGEVERTRLQSGDNGVDTSLPPGS